MNQMSHPRSRAHAEIPPLPPLFRAAKRMRHRISAIIARSSKVPNDPVLDAASFPWIRELETQ
jgi:beta-hydroxylase